MPLGFVTQKSRTDNTSLTGLCHRCGMEKKTLLAMTFFFLVQAEAWIMADCGSRGYESTSYYQHVITSHYIRVEGEGSVDVSHAATVVLFNHEDVLDAVQRVYANLLKEGEKPEFVVEQHGQGRWSYVNKSGNKSEIVELHRCAEPNR